MSMLRTSLQGNLPNGEKNTGISYIGTENVVAGQLEKYYFAVIQEMVKKVKWLSTQMGAAKIR